MRESNRRMHRARIAPVLLRLCLLAVAPFFLSRIAVATPKQAMAPRYFSIFIYAAGDEKSIREAVRSNLRQLEQIPSLHGNTQVNIIVQHDDVGKDANFRYALTPNVNAASFGQGKTAASLLKTPPIAESEIRRIDPSFRYGEKNSGDPRTLKRFLSWAIRAYPAAHYALVLIGHSWGIQGHMQDFFFDDAKHKLSAIIKNYELRRVMQELYREEAMAIKEGVFDLLFIDGCVAGQLEVALELKDVFAYFMTSSIETPYYGLSYDQAFEPFLYAANRKPHPTAQEAHALLEEYLLKRVPVMYVAGHALFGQMVEQEEQYTPVAIFALRTAPLARVEQALTALVSALAPTSLPEEFQKGQLKELDALADSDGHADLLALARALVSLLSRRYEQSRDEKWRAALGPAQALAASLGEHPADEVTTPIRIGHKEATGAWAQIEIDGRAPEPELAACDALRLLAMLNLNLLRVWPAFIDKKGQRLGPSEWLCEGRRPSRKLRLQPGIPVSLDRLLDLRLLWPQAIPAQLVQRAPGKRVLSIWFAREADRPLEFHPVLGLPGASEVTIEYIKGDPLAYLLGQGKDAKLLGKETFGVHPYASRVDGFGQNGQAGGPALYIAEAHTPGTLYKRGLGIFLRRSFTYEFQRYLQGRAPIERVEPVPFGLSLEAYLQRLSEKGTQGRAAYQGADFYRLHRIAKTGWADFLFGHR